MVFVLLVCHMSVLDGFDRCYPASAVHFSKQQLRQLTLAPSATLTIVSWKIDLVNFFWNAWNWNQGSWVRKRQCYHCGLPPPPCSCLLYIICSQIIFQVHSYGDFIRWNLLPALGFEMMTLGQMSQCHGHFLLYRDLNNKFAPVGSQYSAVPSREQ